MQSSRVFARRSFLGCLAVGGVAPHVITSAALGADGRTPASERITLGSIGLGGQGTRDMQSLRGHGDVQVVALCDVDGGSRNYERGWYRGLAPARESTERHYAAQRRAGTYKGCDTYSDFRDLLARDDIDAVNVGTPDHWHGLIVAAAARAGKDIYCQKPLSLTIEDGKAMVAAVHRTDRVFQCGSQRRASSQCRHACELVRSGRIGKLHTVRVGLPGGHSNPGYTMGEERMPVPKGFDYDLWLGPAPWAPYTHKRCHWTFRWIRDYSAGQLTDWGAHFIDMAHWGMGADYTGPVEVMGKGTFPDKGALWDTAVAFHIECTYADGVKMIITSGGGGVRWEGEHGSVDLGGRTNPASIGQAPIGPDEVHLYASPNVYTNFVQCVKTRRITAAPVEVAHRSISVAHLGHISMTLGRKLRWNPEKEELVNDPAATRLLGREKREPWQF
ncbi:MAG: Gfo/Idh/MocA family oxidoreductase [Candidatus Brocadiae bacterium]|nr:Gfo/Idh/MocA family oxidoreductase [Candidatus Brocadiia bacterium]